MNSTAYEELNPELAKYLEPMQGIGQMLRHPLLYSVPYFGECENVRLNKLYEFRTAELRKAVETNNHEQFVFTHERPWRLHALMELHGSVPLEDFLPLVLSVYTDSENARENADDWTTLLEPLTGTDPWDTVSELPDGKFTIYRGGEGNSFSWTTSLKVAQWFANRWGESHPVWTATIDKSNVIGYYNGRNEFEVIVNPDDISHLVEKYED